MPSFISSSTPSSIPPSSLPLFLPLSLPHPFLYPQVAFIEWSDPIYVGGHWTPQLIFMAGGYHTLNPCGDGGPNSYVQVGGAGKSFPVSEDSVVASDPDIVIVSPCGLDLEMSRREADRLMCQPWFANLRAVQNKRWGVRSVIYVCYGCFVYALFVYYICITYVLYMCHTCITYVLYMYYVCILYINDKRLLSLIIAINYHHELCYLVGCW